VVDAEVASPLLALILYVISDKTSIMHNFSQSASIVDVFVCLKIFNIPAEHFCEDQPKCRSPLLTTSVK
jgi:hypothetical protein